jgi:hypothetical protein
MKPLLRFGLETRVLSYVFKRMPYLGLFYSVASFAAHIVAVNCECVAKSGVRTDTVIESRACNQTLQHQYINNGVQR